MNRNMSKTRAGSTPLMIDDEELDSGNNEGLDYYDINQALDYTCSRLGNINSSFSEATLHTYCGQCDRCQINTNLKDCKQWFERASHLTIKNFILELIKAIKIKSIYNYLNNLLKISIDSKDFIYSRNKMIPSILDDQMIISNDRCSNLQAIDESIRNVLQWYQNSNYNIKLNFMVSLLKECEQSIISTAIFQIKTILEAPRTISAMMNEGSFSPANFITPSVTKITPHSTANSKSDTHLFRTSNNSSRNNVMFSVASDYDDDIITDDDSFNGEFDISVLYSNIRVGRKAKYIDFIRQLPVYLSKMILSRLNKKTLHTCLFVSKYWSTLVQETHKDSNRNQLLIDDMLALRGTTSKICNPNYANDSDVKVPNLISGTFQVILNENEQEFKQKTKADFTWENAYKGVSTRKVILEERNVFCGPYNVLLLKDKRDSHRVACLNGETTVAIGSFDKKIRFINIKTAEDKPYTIQGHAGSIKCICISESRGIVITGSFDTSIRCWSLTNNKCVRIFQGHQGTVTCLSFCEENERLVSGSYDKTCRVWSLKSKVNHRIFKHKYPLSAVAVTNEDICISGGYRGSIKVFQISTGKLIKMITKHTGVITGIKFDKWHVITCSTDGYALAFSGQGNHKKCLIAMRHPKSVLCVEFQYLRAITGSADGKIRIWNILNGDCLRVMRGNSQCDPIMSMTISNNRILINTEFNVILMEFQPVVYEYGGKPELDSNNIMVKEKNNNTILKRSYTNIRAKRMDVVGTPNVKIFNDDRKSILSHSSGPISSKNIQEAKIIQSPRKSASATTKLSFVTVNTPMTFNTPTINNYTKSSLHYVNVQSEFKLNSAIPSDFYDTHDLNISRAQSYSSSKLEEVGKKDKREENGKKEDSVIKLDIEHIDQEDANILRYKKLTLDETKAILRNQLRNMRKNAAKLLEQFKNKANTPTIPQPNSDSKSCLETALVNRNQNFFDLELKRSKTFLVRPTSSPSQYDTKTMLRVTADEFQPFINLSNNNGNQLISPSMYTVTPKNPENQQPKSKPIVTKTAVTKVFETQSLPLKTNNSMHPLTVNSKLPNPKIVTPVRPKSSFDRKTENQNEYRSFFTESESQPIGLNSQNEMMKVQRPLTATDNRDRGPCPLMTSQLQRRPPLPKRTPTKSNQVFEKFETNKLLGNDNLNLMTHREVDAIVDKISILFDDSQAVKKKEDEKLYKKLWLLKSTGLYHGSLLAKQKPYAPEIRE